MKKMLSMLLVVILLLSLCACSKNSSQNSNPSSSSQATTDTTGESVKDTTGSTQSTAENLPTTPTAESTGAPTDPAPKPTEAPATKPTEAPATKPTTPAPTTCSHSWEDATCTTPKTCSKCNATDGNALGHTWKDATCTTPKTCAKCNVTEGSVGAHNFVNGSCAVCNVIDSINPKDNLVQDVEYLGYFRVSGTELLASALQFSDEGCMVTDRYFSQEDTGSICVEFQGTRYYSVGGGFSPYHYKLTDTGIVITSESYNDDTGVASIEAIMLGNGMLKITFSSNPSFPVGTILSTNIDDVI